jgi:DNA-binding response OmpR family regulator
MSTKQKMDEVRKPLVLIVDDVPKNIQIVGNMLREEDYDIAFSQSGKEALTIVKSNPIDLVLLDILMPEMDGYEVCKELKKDPQTSAIPVIFLTVKTEIEDLIRGFEVGGEDYVTKPFNSSELLARVRTHLKLKKNRDTILQINEQLKQEIAERKRVEEELKAHREHIRLINRILRHDVINDLVVIKSALRLYHRKKEEDLLKSACVRIDKSTDLIHRMKELECFVSSHYTLKMFTMTDLLEEVLRSYPSITFNIEGDCQVMADESLNSVIDNIISNAVIHGKTDRIDITMKSKDKFCEIRIADYGVGIPDEIKNKIFEESFIHAKTGNTGIGLYIVNKAIKNYGGYVNVEDNTPNGTVFVLGLREVG